MTAHSDETRSEMLNMRINPRTLFLANLAARYRGETLSSFVTKAIQAALAPESVLNGVPKPSVLWNENLWSEDEAERVFMTAMADREMLKPAERRRFERAFTELTKHGRKVTVSNFTKEYYKEAE